MSKFDPENPIPERLKQEFIGYMQEGYDDDDAPDVAWFARMEDDFKARLPDGVAIPLQPSTMEPHEQPSRTDSAAGRDGGDDRAGHRSGQLRRAASEPDGAVGVVDGQQSTARAHDAAGPTAVPPGPVAAQPVAPASPDAAAPIVPSESVTLRLRSMPRQVPLQRLQLRAEGNGLLAAPKVDDKLTDQGAQFGVGEVAVGVSQNDVQDGKAEVNIHPSMVQTADLDDLERTLDAWGHAESKSGDVLVPGLMLRALAAIRALRAYGVTEANANWPEPLAYGADVTAQPTTATSVTDGVGGTDGS